MEDVVPDPRSTQIQNSFESHLDAVDPLQWHWSMVLASTARTVNLAGLK